jgi:probable F420-dependent oxidoreductase
VRKDFRFSCNFFRVEPGQEFVEKCQRVERYGYDTVFAPDHVGAPAPFPMLVAAAAATERIRVGTLVLNASFWNPTLLAREIATTDILTAGRVEVGLGAGHMKWEFELAGIDWDPFAARCDRLAATITDLGRIFEHEVSPLPGGQMPRPIQRHGFGGAGPPLLVGGTGDRILRIAAEHANIIGLAGVYQIPGKPPGTFRLGTAAEADERVRFVREHAGERADELEWQVLIQMVVETDDRRATAKDVVTRLGDTMTIDEALKTPFLLIGTVDEMADQLIRARDRYHFTYFTVHEPYLEALAPVIAHLRPNQPFDP